MGDHSGSVATLQNIAHSSIFLKFVSLFIQMVQHCGNLFKILCINYVIKQHSIVYCERRLKIFFLSLRVTLMNAMYAACDSSPILTLGTFIHSLKLGSDDLTMMH